MAQARTPEPTTNIAPYVGALGVAAGIAALLFHFPGFAVAYIVFIVAGHLATPPVLTGLIGRTKDSGAKPGNPQEQKQLSQYRLWSSLKWSMIVPKSTWFPFWPGKRQQPIGWMANSKFKPLQLLSEYTISQVETQFTFYIAVGAAIIAAAFPVGGLGAEYDQLFRLADAVGVYIAIMQVSAAVRQNSAPEDVAPTPGLQSFFDLLGTDRRGKAIGAAIGAVIASFILCLAFGIAATKFTWWLDVYPLQLWQVTIGISLAASGLILHAAVRNDALDEWRQLVQARTEWDPRWAASEFKLEHPPRLISHKLHNDMVTVDTFEASSSGGAAAGIMKLTPQLTLLMGSGKKIAILEEPDVDAQGQPLQGSMHPLRFRIVTWLTGELPDLSTDQVDETLLNLAVASAFTWAVTEEAKLGRCVPLQIQSVAKGIAGADDIPIWEGDSAADTDYDELEDGDDQSAPAQQAPVPPTPGAWASAWSFPDGGALQYVQMSAGSIGAHLNVEVIVDLKGNTVYFGALTQGAPEFTDPGLAKHFVEMETEARWNRRWTDILKMGARQPVPQHNVYMEAKIPVGPGGRRETIKCQPMVIPQGVQILEYIQPQGRPLEPQLSTTLVAAPFVAITGLSGLSGIKPGDRHNQAIAVYWCDKPLPSTPDQVVPSEDNKGAGWLLAGLLNNAFDVSKLARPELIDAQPITDKTSRGHMWKMKIKLYGGVTVAEVRNQQQKIRQTLNSAWLRVQDAGDGVVIIVSGAKPTNSGFQFAKTIGRRLSNQDYVTSLEWEQAFLVSKVIGDGGKLPTLIKSDVLPLNTDVKVLDFEMPAGVTRGQVKASTQSLMSATNNGYVDVRSSPGGANQVRLLVAETSPLPDRAGVDWEAMDGALGVLPFATGVEGGPVSYDNRQVAHLLVAGASGGGKSVALQVLLYSAAVQGCDLYVVDPTKAGADFGFVKPYSKAFAATVEEGAALMKHVYAEVIRRKNLNAEHQVGSYRDLPEDIRPNHIYLMMDEFTSLMQPDVVSKIASDDPEVEEDRQVQLQQNQSKMYIGTMTGKIAREARSAGVTLILATQKLTAKMLDNIPGAGDLKVNLGRMLLGNATQGDRASALKNFVDAPSLGDTIPRGRGLYEGDGVAEIVQVWFEGSQETYGQMLAERRDRLDPSEQVDLISLIPKPTQISEYSIVGGTTSDDDTYEVDLGALDLTDAVVDDLGEIQVDFASLLAEFEAEQEAVVDRALEVAEDLTDAIPDFLSEWGGSVFDEEVSDEEEDELMTEQTTGFEVAVRGESFRRRPNNHPSQLMVLDVDGVVSPVGATAAGDPTYGDWVQLDVPGMGEVQTSKQMLDRIGQLNARIIWGTDWSDLANEHLSGQIGRGEMPLLRQNGESEYGWWKIDAIAGYLAANPGLRRVIWADDRLAVESDLGITYGELAQEMFDEAGVEVLMAATNKSAGLTAAELDYITWWFDQGEHFTAAEALAEEKFIGSAEPIPAAPVEAVPVVDDFAVPTAVPAAVPIVAAVDDFDEFPEPQSRRQLSTNIVSDF